MTLKYEDWIKEITIVLDNQEKKNYHIKNVFKELGIKTVTKHMKSGDYGFIINGKAQSIIIERKDMLSELSGNLSTQTKKKRFYNEFERVKNCEKILLIENDCIDNMITGTYGTNYKPNSYIANFLLLEKRYNIRTYFVNKYNMATWILKLFYYHYYDKNKKNLI